MSIPFQIIYIHIPKHINYVHESYKLCYYWPRGVESKVYISTISAYGCVYIYLVGGLEHFLFFHLLGISSSQLTNSIIFQRGRSTTNQTVYIYYPHILWIFSLENNPHQYIHVDISNVSAIAPAIKIDENFATWRINPSSKVDMWAISF